MRKAVLIESAGHRLGRVMSAALGKSRRSVAARIRRTAIVIGLLVAALALSPASAIGQAEPSADAGAADAGASGRAHQHESAPPKEDTTSTDVIVSASEDGNGYHLYRATGVDGWVWHPLATIQPGGDGEDAWIGYQCVTGTGRYVVVV